MIHYRIFEETRELEGRKYESFGVAAFNSEGDMICAVADISPDPEKAMRLARMCEDAALSPIHLIDAAEDYIISDLY